MCSGEGDYPSVAEGQISPALCPSGYSYRQCTNGVLGPIIGVDCSSPPPSDVHYSFSSYLFFVGQSVSTGTPSFINTVQRWYLPSQTLPSGLILDSLTGEIHGTPTEVKSITSYSIKAENGGGSVSIPISIEIISSLISYPQTNLTIGQGVFFSITPNLTTITSMSIVSGSLPIGLNLNPSTGVISGSPSQLLSSQLVTIKAVSGTTTETVVLSFTILTPITSFYYSQSSFSISKGVPFSLCPTVDGDELSFSISSGSLPIGLSLNPSTGVLSGTPSKYLVSRSVTIEVSNRCSSIQTRLYFKMITPIIIMSVFITLSIIITILIILIILSKKSLIHLYRNHHSRKLPIRPKPKAAPRTNKPSESVDNPPQVLSNIKVYDH